MAKDVWTDIDLQRLLHAPAWEAVLREGVDLRPTRAPGRVRLQETADFFAFIREELPTMMDRWVRSRAR